MTDSRNLTVVSKKGKLLEALGWKMVVLIREFGELSEECSVEETVGWMHCDFHKNICRFRLCMEVERCIVIFVESLFYGQLEMAGAVT